MMTAASGPQGHVMSEAQRLDWLQLIRSENVGPRTFNQLINFHGGAGQALAHLTSAGVQKKTGRTIVLANRATCEDEYAQIIKAGARLIGLGEPDYPAALRAIDAPPPLITVRGRMELLHQPAVAIVGSRNASASGQAFTDLLARELGRGGLVVVSGLARGIDARAHRLALETGTIAVLAGGHGRVYPSEHVSFAEEIAEKGLLLSEMPWFWEPRGRDFPRRNRLVSGLSLGTIVVEAARRSGSLITAQFALEQGRELFAVPGSPLDPRAEGTNDLLRQGAMVCTSPADVLATLTPMVENGVTARPLFREELSLLSDTEPLWDEADLFGPLPTPQTRPGEELDEPGPLFASITSSAQESASQTINSRTTDLSAEDLRLKVIALMGPSPVAVDDLVRLCQARASQVQVILFELEMAGRLERHGGTLVSLLPEP